MARIGIAGAGVLGRLLAWQLARTGHEVRNGVDAAAVKTAAEKAEINLRYFANGSIGISIDETTTLADVQALVKLFEGVTGKSAGNIAPAENAVAIPANLQRTSAYLTPYSALAVP